MKEISFSRNSWVFKLLCFLNDKYVRRPPEDICALGRALVFNGLKVLTIFSVVICFFIGIGAIVIEKSEYEFMFLHTKTILAMAWYYKMVIAFVVGVVTISGLVALLGGVAFIWFGFLNVFDNVVQEVRNYFYEVVEEPKPGPIVAAYKAFKSKTCYKIKFD